MLAGFGWGYRDRLNMQAFEALAGIVLAAGKGTRMKSDLPKCLHAVCGIPMAEHMGRAMKQIGIAKPVLVIGHGGELLQGSLPEGEYEFVWQREQLGTAHAAIMAQPVLADYDGPVLITPGDVPLVTAEALHALVSKHLATGAKATIGTCRLTDPTGYGRIVRDGDGMVTKIVEHKDATDSQLEIDEINSAIYCFDAKTVFEILPTLSAENAQGEYYLPDAIEKIVQAGGRVETFIYEDFFVFQGVNDPWQLAEASTEMRRRILKRHCLNGVQVIDPATTFIAADVQIEAGTVIHPMTTIEGDSRIGASCHIGPLSVVVSSQVGDGSTVLMSHINRAQVGEDCRIGPYAHLRPKALLGDKVKVGNFVEIKNALLEDGVSAGHLAYLGDAKIGAHSNIGAGTITCNYDGVHKHLTQVGANVFVGSNSTLVAPLEIGEGAYVAAGSVITSPVASDALALGRARQVEKPQWASRRRKKLEQGQ